MSARRVLYPLLLCGLFAQPLPDAAEGQALGHDGVPGDGLQAASEQSGEVIGRSKAAGEGGGAKSPGTESQSFAGNRAVG